MIEPAAAVPKPEGCRGLNPGSPTRIRMETPVPRYLPARHDGTKLFIVTVVHQRQTSDQSVWARHGSEAKRVAVERFVGGHIYAERVRRATNRETLFTTDKAATVAIALTNTSRRTP